MLEQSDLSHRASVPVVTIRRLMAPDGADRVSKDAATEVRRALEEAGADLILDGVRKRASQRPDMTARLDDISRRGAEDLKGRVLLNDDDLYDEDGLPF